MGRIGLAIGMFFKILFNGVVADRVRAITDGTEQNSAPSTADSQASSSSTTAQKSAAPKPAPVAPKPQRSDAVALLSSLQREARFVDLIQEPLDGYDDAQIGAAARDVLQGCAKVIQQTLGVQPIVDLDEGSQLEVPAGFDTGNYRMVGSVSGDPPFTGQLIHHGWQATKCELPAWSGSDEAAKTIAPVEVEV